MDRILLLLDHKENRRLLESWLRRNYQIVPANTTHLPDEPFDLGILDGPALERLWEQVQSRREAEGPLFLPFLLITARQDVKMVTRHLWRTVDELILSPIEKVELQARVEMLLRARRLSLESERRYHALSESSLAGVVIVGQEGRILYANDTFSKICGYTREELLSLSPQAVQAMVHPDDQARVWGPFQDHLAGKAISPRYEYRGIRKDGTVRWLEMHVGRVDYRGQPALQGIVVDVTEQVQAEEALRESETRNRIIAEMISDYAYIFRVTPEGELIGEWVTESFTNVFGYTLEEVVARGGWQSLVHPDDLPIALAHAQKVARGEEDICEMRWVTARGEIRWLRDYAKPIFDETGKRVVRIYGASQDITERRQTEEALKEAQSNLQALLDNRKDYIWSLDRDYNYIVFNKPYADVIYSNLGVRLEKGMNALEIHPKEVVDTWKPKFDEVFKGKYVTFEFSHVLDGEEHFFEVYMNPIYAEGEITGLSALSMDITERKQAEEALRQSRERLNHLFTVNPVMVYELDPENFSTTWVSPNVTEITGYTPEEASQPGLWEEHVHPEDREEAKKTQERLMVEDHLAHEYRFEKKDGTYIWVRDELRLLRDEQGTPKEIVGSWMNITDRKEVEIELQLSEQRYRSIFENTGSAMLIVNEDGSIAFANNQCAVTTGYSPEELQGTEWRRYAFADDLPMMENYFRLRFSDPEKAPNRYETRLIHADGSIRNALLTADIIPSTKQIVVSILDITERVRAEEARRLLETAIDNAQECVMVSDRENRLTYVNRAFEKLTGYAAAEVLGKTPGILKSGRHDQEFYQDLKSTIYSGRSWQGDLILKKKDGTLYEVAATITPILNASGQVDYFVSVHRDVTEEREMERRIQQHQRLEAIGTLAGGIAHDFNNILTPIVGYTELCIHILPSDSRMKKYLEEVKQAAHRGAELVQQILSFSRSRPDKDRKPLRIAPIVKEASKLLRASIPSTIDIKEEIYATTELIVADPTEIHQVMMNLGTNAYQAMPDGGVLTVSLKAVDLDSDACATLPNCKPGRYLKLSVEDTGCGIPPEIQDKIFEPYFTTKEEGRGTGLGLAIVHSIVTGCGGEINVYSERGKGTRFDLYFPVVSRPVTETEEVEKTAVIRGGHERILLVDDDIAVLNLHREVLENYGYSVTAASDPEQALAIFETSPADFDMVLTDMTMPHMTGDLLAAALIEIRPDLPVVVLTGFSEWMNEDKAQELGIRRLLTKPVSVNDLITTIRDILDGK